MSRINKLIAEHEKLRYLEMCLKNLNCEKFRADVLGHSSKTLRVDEDAQGSRAGILYRIRIGSKGDGFFAEYRQHARFFLYKAGKICIIYKVYK